MSTLKKGYLQHTGCAAVGYSTLVCAQVGYSCVLQWGTCSSGVLVCAPVGYSLQWDTRVRCSGVLVCVCCNGVLVCAAVGYLLVCCNGVLVCAAVGYSTCHWCHVMERESFEKDDVADILNENFVSVKVDREERPDVDKVYMSFVQVSGAG